MIQSRRSIISVLKYFMIETGVELKEGLPLEITGEKNMIAGGIMPVTTDIKLETADVLKAGRFSGRRKIGPVNVGMAGENLDYTDMDGVKLHDLR